MKEVTKLRIFALVIIAILLGSMLIVHFMEKEGESGIKLSPSLLKLRGH
jgi:hypothetical protein